MFMPFVCRIVIGKDRTFSRFPRKYHMARVGTVSPLRRDRGFESPFLQRRVTNEPSQADTGCRDRHYAYPGCPRSGRIGPSRQRSIARMQSARAKDPGRDRAR
jgi:hypothetical protein